jgi:hypothetical protein
VQLVQPVSWAWVQAAPGQSSPWRNSSFDSRWRTRIRSARASSRARTRSRAASSAWVDTRTAGFDAWRSRGLRPAPIHIDISLMAVDGSDVLTWYDLHTSTTEPLPTVNWSHVENGLISRIRAVFDPRPLFPSDAGS